ncbi:TetR/AcrR family transcriptional regulator [Nucisporomicrobium flavum]|uniref:TetR/AcrR family transcriptional regulator n=1 Tax=Nucisporomicrobium flavum TaxID=2785915 RepID=UPI0018F36321|nr:TetR-like C-terminal domain-containing protein [Nucisporomicrobium flavum]
MRVRGRYDQLVAAAMELASPGLPLSVPSLRAVARECGVTPTAVYRHFPSQSSLNRVILLTIDQAFVTAVSAADDPARPPADRLRGFAHAYAAWGLAHPGLYQLRFESADQLGEDYVRTDAADKLLAHIDSVIAVLDEPSEATAEDLWVGLHGVVSLRIHKRDRPWSVAVEEQIDRLLRAWGIG